MGLGCGGIGTLSPGVTEEERFRFDQINHLKASLVLKTNKITLKLCKTLFFSSGFTRAHAVRSNETKGSHDKSKYSCEQQCIV